ncbi:MAG: hypothetical protein J1F64_08805 [Oscillospiraceae bacterium]|nr:hypothetical protein [Oscillospiraceae bacterium]
MCGLYGFLNYSGSKIGNLSALTNSLAKQAAVRGTDATGIAYNDKSKIIIQKDAKSAYQINLNHPDNTVCVTGHTRYATQGNKKQNYNNHPFGGSCENLRFALCHNGILNNDNELKKEYQLPKTKIETDSYVAVQLLEKKKLLDFDSVKFMAETIVGSFAFSILESDNNLWLVRGDSPLSLVHLPNYELYIYASTDEILYKALVDTKLFQEIKTGNFEEIKIHSGDIIKILSNGKIMSDKFNYNEYLGGRKWWEYDMSGDYDTYVDELKYVASYQEYSGEDVDELLEQGFTTEEIEEYLYCCE